MKDIVRKIAIWFFPVIICSVFVDKINTTANSKVWRRVAGRWTLSSQEKAAIRRRVCKIKDCDALDKMFMDYREKWMA